MSELKIVGVVGAGTMGQGIAQAALAGGYQVILYDRAPEVIERAAGFIDAGLKRAAEKGRMTAEEAAAAFARLTRAGSLQDLAPAGLVVEAVLEIELVKKDLFLALSPILAPDAVVATNTSSYKVVNFAESLSHPERLLGLHYFFPPAVNPLVEVIRGPQTSQAAVDLALSFVQTSKKVPLVCRDSYGFAVNRFFVPYINEAARLAEEGFDKGEIDLVAREIFQTAVGPFKIMDLSKPEIAVHAARTLSQLGSFYAPAENLVALGEAHGFWNVADAAGPVAEATRETITNRLRAAIFLPVLEAASEGVASPADLDLGAKLALAWGVQPWQTMQSLGKDAVAALIQPLLARYGVKSPAALETL